MIVAAAAVDIAGEVKGVPLDLLGVDLDLAHHLLVLKVFGLLAIYSVLERLLRVRHGCKVVSKS